MAAACHVWADLRKHHLGSTAGSLSERLASTGTRTSSTRCPAPARLSAPGCLRIVLFNCSATASLPQCLVTICILSPAVVLLASSPGRPDVCNPRTHHLSRSVAADTSDSPSLPRIPNFNIRIPCNIVGARLDKRLAHQFQLARPGPTGLLQGPNTRRCSVRCLA